MAKDNKKDFFKILENIATLSDKDGITKEFNLVQYEALVNPILDIRKWDNNGDFKKMGKGITLTEDEARKLRDILNDYFKDNKEA
jgi:hypothetical protein